jgi:hypothetical protein
MAFSNRRVRTGAVTVDTTSGGVQILPSNPDRLGLKLWNTHASVVATVGMGVSTVAAGSGIPMAAATAAGLPLELDGTDAVRGIAASGSVVVAYAETYRANG